MFRPDRNALLTIAVIAAMTTFAPLHYLRAANPPVDPAPTHADAQAAKIRREIDAAVTTSRHALEHARHGASARAELADAARHFDAAERAADALGRAVPAEANVAKELHDEAKAGRTTALLGSADLELARSNLPAALADVDLVLVDDASNATAMRLRADIESAAAAVVRDSQMLLVAPGPPGPIVVQRSHAQHDPRPLRRA